MARRTKRRRRARCRKRRREKRLQDALAETQVSDTDAAEIGELRRFIDGCYAVGAAVDRLVAESGAPPKESD